MTPEQLQLLNDIDTKLNALIDIYYRIHFVDKEIFANPVFFNGGINIRGGTSLKTDTTAKVGLFGVTQVAQAGAISAPSGGTTIDSQSRTAIGSIITALHNIGITA